jgi:hypothetical protein
MKVVIIPYVVHVFSPPPPPPSLSSPRQHTALLPRLWRY